MNFSVHLKTLIKRILFNTGKQDKNPDTNLWSGNYKSWAEACKNSEGYNTNEILEKVKHATKKVINGEALFERDSVLFHKPDYNYSLLSILLTLAIYNGKTLNVIDFGGSLGSTYYQFKRFLKNIKELRWNIIEQEGFVKTGKEVFENKNLHFYYSIDECLEKNSPHVVLFSSVLSYIENPYEILTDAATKGIPCILIDRHPVFDKADRITIQQVPSNIYKASYPSWIFNEQKMIDFFFQFGYTPELELKGFDPPIKLEDTKVNFKGYVFSKKSIL